MFSIEIIFLTFRFLYFSKAYHDVFLFVGGKTQEKFKQVAMETAVNYVKEAISAERRHSSLSVTLVHQVKNKITQTNLSNKPFQRTNVECRTV